MRCRSLLALASSIALAVSVAGCAHVAPSLDGRGIVARGARVSVGALSVRRELRYYDVHSTSLADIPVEVRGMRARNEAPAFYGATSWGISLVRRGGGVQTNCASGRLGADISIVTTLPRAVNAGRFSPQERERWNEFLHGLAQHEQRHDSIAIAEAQRGLARLSSSNDGSPRGIRECTQSLLAEIRREHETLDAVTGHGRTDGAVLRVRGVNGVD